MVYAYYKGKGIRAALRYVSLFIHVLNKDFLIIEKVYVHLNTI